MGKKKKEVHYNLVNIAELLNGRDYRELDEKEQLEIARKIRLQIFPESQK